MEALGFAGSVLLALCGAPQAYESFKNKHSGGVSIWFILMWFVGEWCLLVYSAQFGSIPLYLNYSFNIAISGIILWYKLFPLK